MPESRPPTRLSLRFAAFGALAALMVLLPLGEVLRYQTDEVQMLTAERAMLDPLAHAVALQRSLIGHGEAAARVLAGRRQLEGERRLRQAEVDGAVHELKGTLSAGMWDRALAETDDLAYDWQTLAGRIQRAEVDVAGSQAGHRLLVEQALQVMDLVHAGMGNGTVAARMVPVRPPGQPSTAAATGRRAAPAGPDLEAAQTMLMALRAQLDERLARTHAARNHQIAGLALLLAGLAGALLWTLRRQAQPDARPPRGTDPGQRRGRGRRSTDGAPAAGTAQGLIDQLRQAESGAADAASALPLPPGR